MFRSLRARLPRIGRTPRLLIAATCLLMALASALGSGPKPAAAGGRPVVVAARDLPAGHVLGRADLAVARLPAALRPAGARAGPAAFVRQRLAGPIGAREVLTASRLVSADLAAGLGRLVAAAVPLDDPRAADLLRPGNRIDLLEATRAPDVLDAALSRPPPVTIAAAGVLVLAVLPQRDDGSADLIVAIARTTALTITRDRSGHVFTAVVVPP
jgi:Flp pilus assembly protein CpaB